MCVLFVIFFGLYTHKTLTNAGLYQSVSLLMIAAFVVFLFFYFIFFFAAFFFFFFFFWGIAAGTFLMCANVTCAKGGHLSSVLLDLFC